MFTNTLRGCETVGKSDARVGDEFGKIRLDDLPVTDNAPESKEVGVSGKKNEEENGRIDGTVGRGGTEFDTGEGLFCGGNLV